MTTLHVSALLIFNDGPLVEYTCYNFQWLLSLLLHKQRGRLPVTTFALQSCSCMMTSYNCIHLVQENFFLQYYSGADTRASDKSGMNPFMLAVEKGNLEVVRVMMEKDPNIVSSPVGCGSTMIHWALKQGHLKSDFFKVCFYFIYLAILLHFNLICPIPIFFASLCRSVN